MPIYEYKCESCGQIQEILQGRELYNMTLLQKAKEKLTVLADKHSLLSEQVSVRAKPLSPEQAIGRPKREDFPIIKGKEVMIQAEFIQHFGQAFTDNPGNFQGSLQDVRKPHQRRSVLWC